MIPDDNGPGCHTPERDRRNQRRILAWALAWAGTWVAVGLAARAGRLAPGPLTTAAALVPTLLAVGMLLAYRRFLREADELRRKVELDALALAFGVGVAGGLGGWLLARVGAVPEVGAVDVVAAMVLTHAAGVVVGQRRYR